MAASHVAGHGSEDQRLSKSRLLAFSLPAVPISALGLPLVVHLPTFYAKEMGLSLTIVGSLFLIARFWDVFTDPVLGVLSDRVRSRWGRRRHWIVLSVPIIMLSVFMVFMPAPGVTDQYLLFWMLFLYVGWTLLTISHMSWGAELTPVYHDRSRVQAAREIALILGMVFVLIVPDLLGYLATTLNWSLPSLIDMTSADHASSARVALMGLFVIILLPIFVAIAVAKVPEQAGQGKTTALQRQDPMSDIPKAIGILIKNRPLQYVLIIDLISGVSGGIVASLFLFLAIDAFKLTDAVSNLLLICYFVSGVLFIPLVLAISRRIGKHKATAFSAVFSGATIPLILAVPEGNAVFALICWVLFGMNMAAGPILFRSMMADVADHDAVESGEHRTGVYYSMLTMTNKVGHALAIGISFVALDLVGFVPGGENGDDVLMGLRLVYVLPASIIGFVVAFIVWRFPLDEAQQLANRTILETRALDAAAIAVTERTAQTTDIPSTITETPAE